MKMEVKDRALYTMSLKIYTSHLPIVKSEGC